LNEADVVVFDGLKDIFNSFTMHGDLLIKGK
jgi:hypothetical protein